MRQAPVPIMRTPGVTDQTTRAKIFDWISNVLDQSGLGAGGGAIILFDEEPSTVRDWKLDPVAEDQIASIAGIIADEIIQEAEAWCEGAGGGEMNYIIHALRNGDRSHFRKRAFSVAIEESRSKKLKMSSHKDELAMLARQNEDLHKVVLSHASQAPKIIESLRKQIHEDAQLKADNYALLRANIEDREGREAAAFSTIERTAMLKDFGGMVIKTLIPSAMQYIGPHVGPLIFDWMSRPENAQAATKIMGMITAFASNTGNDPNNPNGQGQ